MKLYFTKIHGLGNDFILVEYRSIKSRRLSGLSKKLCNRRFGIGADQLLVLCDSTKADYKIRIFNADGSEVEMCGNGIRCVAKHIWESRLTPTRFRKSRVLSIETMAGIIYPEKSGTLVKVDMGEPIFAPELIPVAISRKVKLPLPRLSKGIHSGANSRLIINYPLKIKNKSFKITCLSMGNPHAVIVVKNTDSVAVDQYGPLIENHRLFPKRTNVEFIQIINKSNIKMRVWERGTGETLACGTGASAAGVASVLLGLANRKMNLHFPGGKLSVQWSAKDNHVYMTGSAEKVFDGIVDI